MDKVVCKNFKVLVLKKIIHIDSKGISIKDHVGFKKAKYQSLYIKVQRENQRSNIISMSSKGKGNTENYVYMNSERITDGIS